jgi:hypothetical protein
MTEPFPDHIAEILGVQDMNVQQQEAFFAKVGGVLLDSVITRLLLTLTEEEMLQINLDLDVKENDDDPFSYFLNTFPQFEGIVREEVAALQAETIEIME